MITKKDPKKKQTKIFFPLSFQSFFILFLEVKKHFGNVFGYKIIDNIFKNLLKKIYLKTKLKLALKAQLEVFGTLDVFWETGALC